MLLCRELVEVNRGTFIYILAHACSISCVVLEASPYVSGIAVWHASVRGYRIYDAAIISSRFHSTGVTVRCGNLKGPINQRLPSSDTTPSPLELQTLFLIYQERL